MEEIARRDELWVLLPGFRMSEWAESRGNSVLTHNNTAISAPASAKQRMHKVPASPNLKYARKYFKPFAVATARPIPMPVTQLEQAFPSIIPVNARCRRNRRAAESQEGRALMGELVLTIPAITATPNGATPIVSGYAKQNRERTANRTLARITQFNNHLAKGRWLLPDPLPEASRLKSGQNPLRQSSTRAHDARIIWNSRIVFFYFFRVKYTYDKRIE